ncbi:hypothetical protein OSB04_023410 [Centaurea solstitialis]|uniref:Uncharacterized protein n=1 Tax=Centaurea solstitialis TaxID=347529 RepID=A0AA38SJT8_9ASTR|nr:hypothetical protein OSB04_023410 [Centaurea solstitialis]
MSQIRGHYWIFSRWVGMCRERNEDNVQKGDQIPTDENVADPLTKPLARAKHEGHASSIGMRYLDTDGVKTIY